MNIADLIDQADLDRGIADRLINVRESGTGLRIFNYSDAALFTPGAWDNPAVRQCRGLIVNEAGEVVARPWAKFFNHGQAEAGDLDLVAPVEVTDKLDGSLGILYVDTDGTRKVASRGSFLSDQARHATKVLNGAEPTVRWPEGFTPLVEIIYPANRIVCDYGDRDELVLLGGVWIDSGEYVGPLAASDLVNWEGRVAQTFPYPTLHHALEAPPRPGMEGLCVRYLDEPRIVKIKQEDYVALHRIVTGLSERTVWQHMVDDKPLADLLGPLPDELHDWTKGVWSDLLERANSLRHASIKAHDYILASIPEGDRRAYADHAKAFGILRPFLFMHLDERDALPAILKTLRPAGRHPHTCAR